MQIIARGALALMLLYAQAVDAQIRLPQLPVALPTQALHNTAQLLDQTQSQALQRLSDLRLLEIARLVRANPTQVELDPDGQLIVRSEILALTPTEAAIDRARAAGFTVIRAQNLESLGLRVIVLGVPRRLGAKKSLRQLRESDPDGTYDYNHIYLGSGIIAAIDAPQAPSTPAIQPASAVAPPKLRVGLIDTGIDTNHPAFATAAIQRWGCDDKPVAAAHGTAVASLLIGHADVLAFTLTHGPQHYEPRFYAHKIEGNSVPIIDEWCCGYVKGIALDPVGWQPLIDARPDWFEVIHLYGTKSGWDRLKELVGSHEDSVARHQAFVDRIGPAARNIHAYWLARRALQEKLRQPVHTAPAPGRNDPCPCGSGKKFKRCHGAPGTLH